jgi:methylmalonyl-CoA mutase C-terminal domain/subunit
MELLKEAGARDVLVIGGGIIPEEDIPSLKEAGIQGIFGPGTPTTETVRFIQENVRR